MSTTTKEIDFSGFTGTEQWHRYSFFPVLLTDGVKYLAEEAECFWLMDLIYAKLLEDRLMPLDEAKDNTFFVVRFALDGIGGGNLTISNGREPDEQGYEPPNKHHVNFTDFPLREFEFYVQWDWSIKSFIYLLKSEY